MTRALGLLVFENFVEKIAMRSFRVDALWGQDPWIPSHDQPVSFSLVWHLHNPRGAA